MSVKRTSTENSEVWVDIDLDDTALKSLLDNPLEESSNISRLRDGTQHAGFDNNMGESWIYPNNLPCRSYQMNIVQTALYNNTLVVLPTGLGKTFIAAVVMYNFYRWYPRGKIIFMAPTKPLVNQQIEACQNIMPFPRKDITELTGKLNRSKRTELWKTNRVFFATPQVVQSDIVGGRQLGAESVDESSFQEAEQASRTEFPFDFVKLIVVDEAHRAKGKYAYTEVIQALARNTKYFRVLALSATPGRTVDDVAEVCRNLLISRLEVRWDTSLDVLPYVQKRTMDTIVVSMGDKIKEIREELLLIVDPYLRQLTEAGVLSGSLTNINRNFLLYEQKRFRDRSLHSGRHPHHSAITTNFAICISLYHALELLERHGLRVFLNNFLEDEEGKNKFVLQMDRRLNDLVENLKTHMGKNPFEFSAAPMTNGKIAEIPKDLDFGHPKFEKTRECLLQHFEKNKDSRAIVFCEYRESVMLIYRMLLQHVPLLQPRCFVGQGGTGCLRALTQKQQIQIMNDFRSGKSNILIATSIGEEGIDVGEVELIVCFDISTSNPMRFVQRIGRTGRKKNGHVIMMVTEGREQQLLREVLSNKDQINKKLLKSSVVQQSLYKNAPRLVPTEFKPKCIQTFVKPPPDDEKVPATKVKRISNKKTISPNKPASDLRKFFQKKPKELDKEDMDYFESETQITQIKPGLQTQQNIVNKLDKMKNLFKDLRSAISTQTQTQKGNKNTPTKLNNSQGSIKDFFKDSPTTSKRRDNINKDLNSSQTTSKDLSAITIDLCGDDEDQFNGHDKTDNSTRNDPDAGRLSMLEKFLKTSFTSKQVLKRAEIKDLGFHLKSKELSTEMQKLLLTMRPEFLKDNLEQMQILKALHENEISNCTEEEKSIREINHIILELFGGLANVEHFLDASELDKYKKTYLDSDSETEEEDPQDMENFQKRLDNIFILQKDAEVHNNYAWIQQRFRETKFHKDTVNLVSPKRVQESMVYETFAEPDDENTLNNFEDCSIIESKYCSQWQEFEINDIAFKSTPVRRPANGLLDVEHADIKSKPADAKDGHEILNTSATNTKQVQHILLRLENKLKETSINEANLISLQPDLNEIKRNSQDKHLLEAENNIPPIQHFEEFNLPDEDELIMAAAAAELKFTQSQLPRETNTNSSSLRDLNTHPQTNQINNAGEDSNPAMHFTPELDLSPSIIKKDVMSSTTVDLKKPAYTLSLQQDLDIDMEAFMEPFPEEQELLQDSPISKKEESIKENITDTIIPSANRESPDIFAEEHTKNTVQKPTVCIRPNLANLLSAKLSRQKCQSSLNPTTSFKSPQKRLFSTQNPQERDNSPPNRSTTDKQRYEKSPSIFDMYMQSTKGKKRLPKSSVNMTTSLANPLKQSPVIPSASQQQNDSAIMLRNRKGIASKRKIFDSDSEREDDDRKLKGLTVIDAKSDQHTDSDFEEIAATQIPKTGSIFYQRRKRRRFNSFLLQQEAGVSGSDQSEDENEDTIGGYAYDSVVVASDEEDPDQASTSHMQAMYLQSLKSPQQRRGTFKIPARRVYNDHSRIFSQAVIPEETYSQYLPDSFVVDEEDCTVANNAEITMCPLERAEKILKERRRAKKLSRLVNNDSKRKSKTRTKKLQIIESSSEDDDFE